MFQQTVSDKMRVKVFKVKLYDVLNDQAIISRRMATEVGAQRMGGKIIQGTEILIMPSQLEPGEEWTKRDFVPELL